MEFIIGNYYGKILAFRRHGWALARNAFTDLVQVQTHMRPSRVEKHLDLIAFARWFAA